MFKQTKKPLFQLRFGVREFAPHLLPTLGFLFFFLLTIFLAHWQWDRSIYKQKMLDEYQARPLAAAVSLETVENAPANYQYNQLILKGHYDNTHTFLLDNSMHHSIPGYMVITPFELTQNKKIILVNRGWMAGNKNRQDLPNISSILGEQTIHGIIKLPPEKVFLLGNNSAEIKTWPMVIEGIQLSEMQKDLHHSTESFLLLLNADEKNGYIRDWQPTLTMGPQKHMAYAVQWLALGFTLVIMYALLNLRRIE